jgi:hypothetical protein
MPSSTFVEDNFFVPESTFACAGMCVYWATKQFNCFFVFFSFLVLSYSEKEIFRIYTEPAYSSSLSFFLSILIYNSIGLSFAY